MKKNKPNLLLVDDEPKNRYAMSRMINAEKINLVLAESGEAALRALVHQDFFAILMDVSMPLMSGFEAAKLIRENPKTRHIPLIFVTAQHDQEFIFKGYRVGAVDYIQKPVEPLVLQSKLKVFKSLWERRVKLKKKNKQLAKLNKELSESEQQLNVANKKLQTQIAARKRNAIKLIQARKEADLANQAKGNFLANMSHEIRTPLNAIAGMAHLLLKSNLNAKQRDYLVKLNSASESLLQIINEILDFSKIEADRLELESIGFSLKQVVQNVISLMHYSAEKKNIDLIYEIEEGIPKHLIGDPTRIGQILLNLVSNAIKFTAKGSVKLIIKRAEIENYAQHKQTDEISKNEMSEEVVREAKKSVNLYFEVRDSGIGMSQAQMEKLFQPFMQADSSTTRRYGGTGLGLAISQKLLRLMNSELKLSSKLNNGSIFSFILQLEICHKPDKLLKQFEMRQSKLVSLSNDKKVKIGLLVNDQQERDSLSQHLSCFAVQVFPFESDEQLMSALKQPQKDHFFDLVLIELTLPDMKGSLLVSKVQQHLQKKVIPPIVFLIGENLTESQHQKILDEMQRLGMAQENLLVKPVTGSELLIMLQSILGLACELKQNGIQLLPHYAELPLANDERHCFSGKRVLLVEDDPLNQEIAIDLLKQSLLEVELAENGQQAVEMLLQSLDDSSRTIDLVLMDCQMPVMDGYQATKLIRQQQAFKNLPIIAMTANVLQGEREKCLSAGMSDYLTKPIEVLRLYELIQQWLCIEQPLAQLKVDCSHKFGEKCLYRYNPSNSMEITPSVPSEKKPVKTSDANAAAMLNGGSSEKKLWLDIPGIDLTQGLRLLGGNKSFYRKMLKKFILTNVNIEQEVRQMLVDNQWQEAARKVHNFKSAAGSLGLSSLQSLAESLEQTIKHQQAEMLELALDDFGKTAQGFFQHPNCQRFLSE